MSGRRTPRMTSFDVPDNAPTQIFRTRLRHRKSPPDESESQFQPNRNPYRFKLTVRRSSSVVKEQHAAPLNH
jgi:hypothetical protein